MTSPVQPGMEAVIRMPNMVATLLRDDTYHVSLLSLAFSNILFFPSSSSSVRNEFIARSNGIYMEAAGKTGLVRVKLFGLGS